MPRLARPPGLWTATLAAVLSLLLLAALLAWLPPAWRWGLLVLALAGHPLLLVLEFTLMRRAQRSVGANDPTPRASPAQLLRAWLTESLATPRVFAWRMLFFRQAWPDHLPPDAQGRRGVLLLHGFVCNRGIWNPWLARLRAQNVPVVAVTLAPVFGSIDRYVPLVDQAVQRLQAATGLAPIVVAHSMGGLALRAWYAGQADAAALHQAITLGTPHRGTWLAHLAFSLNGRQMRLDSPWLRALAARETAAHRVRFLCLYSHCDNIVFPPERAVLPGAGGRQHVPGSPHVHLVDRPEAWQALQAALAPEPARAVAPGS